MRKSIRKVVIWLALLGMLLNPLLTRAQDDPEKFIAKLVEQMSPQAKVGQLFVVAFSGTATNPNSDVAELILRYNVGGVALSTAAGNIVNTGNTPQQVAALTAALQGLARTAAQVTGPTGKTAPFIPLFIAAPHDQTINGTTPLPPPLALGAAWNREDAYATGKLAGQELAALGINVLFGPSFDLLTIPAAATMPPATQMFGGDPYWVNTLGQAYTRGLREGSQNRVIAALAHFPGQGGAVNAEGIIDKSLDELNKQDLLPFLQALTTAPGETRPLADALLITQMRYRGFSGNIRERTRPLVVDAQAMQVLLNLPTVKAWREAGGVLFSDSLGSATLRHYYSSQRITAPTRRVAQEAFLAGSDVLVLSDFGGESWSDQFQAITDTISFFQDKYLTDLTFQARVNDAVARILRLKYRLYPNFDPAAVPVDAKAAAQTVGLGQLLVAQVARHALTQLWPRTAVPVIEPQDTIVILTDEHKVRECPACPLRETLGTDALARTMLRLYGPSGRIDAAKIISLTLGDVKAFFDQTSREGAPDAGAALGAANWVILAMVDAQAEPTATLVRQLLVERYTLLANKKVAVLAFGTPALNKEQVSHLTAYYGLYSPTPPFIELAARVLFGDAVTQGAPPISVPAIGYDLSRQTEPDPLQFIQIFAGEAPTSDMAVPKLLSVKVGDTLKLRTAAIKDRNGHPVPDGTPVTFMRVFSETLELPALTVGTRDGVATVEITLDKIGPLRIRAISEPALTSYELRVTTLDNQPGTVSTIAPPTLTPAPAPPTPTPVPSPTASPTPTATPVPQWWEPLNKPAAPRRVDFGDLIMALFGIAGVSLGGYYLILKTTQGNEASIIAIRGALWCGGAGLTGYVLYGLGAPGIDWLARLGSLWASLTASIIFAALPVAVILGRRRFRRI